MAIDAKQSFLSQVEHRCADMLTVAEMPRIMGVISDLLQGFRMEELKDAETAKDDDLLDAFMASLRVQGRSEKTIARYWDIFKCVELPVAKHWDGHTDKDVWRLLLLT